MRFTTLIARNLLRRGVRTALTVVGLAIGIAAVVALLGIAWGFERSFLAINEAKGIDLVVVRAGVSDKLTSNLDEAIGDRLRKVEGVREVAGSLMDVVSFEEANLVSVLINGWEPGSLLFRGIQVLEGRTLAQGGWPLGAARAGPGAESPEEGRRLDRRRGRAVPGRGDLRERRACSRTAG